VALGENGVKTVEDLADCATDDLIGWNERKDKESIHHDGFLDAFSIGRAEAEQMILAARVKAGWIEEPVAEEVEVEEVEAEGDDDDEAGTAPEGTEEEGDARS